MTTTQELTVREAQLKEAARDLLHVSKQLNPDQTVDYGDLGGIKVESANHHVLVASALQSLDYGRLGDWTDYSKFTDEVIKEEGSGNV